MLALAGLIALKAPATGRWASWPLRLALALPLFGASLWLVFAAIPYPKDPGMPTFSIVASGVFVSALAIEELVGTDVRRFLGIR